MPTAQDTTKTPYRVRADSIEACNCQHGCNCQFEGFPNEGKCEFIIGCDVTDGRFGQVSLNGFRAEHGDLRLEWPRRYVAAETNWTNQ